MAKQKPNGARPKPPVRDSSFTNSAGDTFKLFPVNPLEEQLIRDQVKKDWLTAGKALPKVPAIIVENAAGDRVELPLHSEKDADTPELLEQWKAYQYAEAEMQAEFSTRFMTSLFLCVDADPTEFPGWYRRMRVLKLDIPEDPDDAFLTFVQSWVIRSKEDLESFIFSATSSIIAMDEESRAAAEAAFRNQMEKAYTLALPRTEGR
jgi:hypothetical protein